MTQTKPCPSPPAPPRPARRPGRRVGPRHRQPARGDAGPFTRPDRARAQRARQQGHGQGRPAPARTASTSLSYKKVPGWTAKLTKERLDPPVDLEGFAVDQQVTRIVWTGNPKRGGIIRPDQFEEFHALGARARRGGRQPARASRRFQTYRGGERVRWTGAPDSETPAPARDADRARGGIAASRSLQALEPEEGARAQ